MMTGDQIVFLGKVAEWLKDAPVTEFSYGSFYVQKVSLGFDGDPSGAFLCDGDGWVFEEAPE